MTTAALEWARDGADWPNREVSRFVKAAGIDWHVQIAGAGPVLLLLHGTGAATHSWRDLLAPLSARHTVVAPDLPGHGFTGRPNDLTMTLPGMASALSRLLEHLELTPAVALGHSAGAAIAARMALDRPNAATKVISLNGALLPFSGFARQFFGPLARGMAESALAAQGFATYAKFPGVVERLIRQTGSTIDPMGLALYRRLVTCPAHVSAALRMMANWQLEPLVRDLPALGGRLVMIAAGGDRAVPATQSVKVRGLAPGARYVHIRGLGHLAHEERPDQILALLAAELP
jgi:magnesium chelatase accessory protein